MVGQITFYTAMICPYAHRVEIALEEVKANYKKYEIDLFNKPEWYEMKINPAGRVPALSYGGPDVPPHQPSPDSEKIAESLVLLEFLADLFTDSPLLPKDPVLRARARFFIDTVHNKFHPGWTSFVLQGESNKAILEGLEALQNLLPPEDKSKYVIGDEFTIADASIAPFLGRVFLLTKLDIGVYDEGEGKKTYETLRSDKFKRLRNYYDLAWKRESVQKAFNEPAFLEFAKKNFGMLRDQRQKQKNQTHEKHWRKAEDRTSTVTSPIKH